MIFLLIYVLLGPQYIVLNIICTVLTFIYLMMFKDISLPTKSVGEKHRQFIE